MILSCIIGVNGEHSQQPGGEGGLGSGGWGAPPNHQAHWYRNQSKCVVVIGNMDIIGNKWGWEGKEIINGDCISK